MKRKLHLIAIIIALMMVDPNGLTPVRAQNTQVFFNQSVVNNFIGVSQCFPGANPAYLMVNPNAGDNQVNNEKSGQSHLNQQTVIVPQGWSGLSSYIVPDDQDIENLFLPVQDQLIILYNLQGVYYPSQQLNTLGEWNPQSGYIARFSQETGIEFSGQAIENGALNLSVGWSLMPVLSSLPVNVEALFEGKDVEVVKEVAGYQIYWPGMDINTLTELLPGEAYFVYMNSAEEISFICNPQPTQANAGADQLNIASTNTTLQGNTPIIGTGQWSIVEGAGGNLSNPASPTSTFNGMSGNTYILRWTISNACSTSTDDVTISFSIWSCGMSFTVNHLAGNVAPVAKTVVYGTATNIPGETSKCWITSNLGSNHQALSVDDGTEASAGWYWQFNKSQGFKNNGTTVTPAWTVQWINENSDWATSNDPCAIELGIAWRLPTYAELNNIDAASGWGNWSGPWNSALKMHAAGYLNSGSGEVSGMGATGYYWSISQNDNTTGWYITLSGSSCGLDGGNKASGFTVRCLKD